MKKNDSGEYEKKLDDFAKAAMKGILSSHFLVLPEDREKLAEACFAYAEAMIAASAKWMRGRK